jgi:hypothetical protein
MTESPRGRQNLHVALPRGFFKILNKILMPRHFLKKKSKKILF